MIVFLKDFEVDSEIRQTKRGYSVLIKQNSYSTLVFADKREQLESFLENPAEVALIVRPRLWRKDNDLLPGLKFVVA